MYRVDRNNFYKEQKKATVYTPDILSQFIFSILSPRFSKDTLILDPCVGNGSLLKPFQSNGYKTIGVDIENQGFENTVVRNYLSLFSTLHLTTADLCTPGLIIMNPPFNIDDKTKAYIKKNYKGRPLLPEIWLQKTIALFGKKIPMVLFATYGFRLNQTIHSKRWQKFLNNEYPPIKSIISLPKDVFQDILFHCEILIFNINGLQPHYFYYPCNWGCSIK